MLSSPVLLSISTVFALVGIVLACIAFSTDNWEEYDVQREAIFAEMSVNDTFRRKMEANQAVQREFIYFDRTYGMLRVCFPNQVPNDSGSEESPFGTHCVFLGDDYNVPADSDRTKSWSDDRFTRMHLMRTQFMFYIIGLAFLGVTLVTGVCGCWTRHAGSILATGILLLFATLFLAASMAVWHGIDYLTREVILDQGFEMSWPAWLDNLVRVQYGWSYVISWVAIACILTSSFLMLAAYRIMKMEEEDEIEKKAAPYMMASYYDKASSMAPYQPYGYQMGYGGSMPPYSPYGMQYGSQYGGSQYGFPQYR